MKALSRKRRLKTGRPRKDGERYPSGDRKRSETEREAKAVVIEARERHYGLTPDQAKSDLAGHALGRLYMARLITKDMFEAGLRYGDDVRRYFAYYLGTAPTVAAQNLMKVRGFDGDVSEGAAEKGRKAVTRYMELDAILPIASPRIKAATYAVCVDDDAANVSQLQAGLLKLADYYGIGGFDN